MHALLPRSIPIVSKLDFTTPAYNTTTNCGVGMVAWNVVAASPFAKEVSVNDWTELPALLNSLRRQSDDYINRLQVHDDGSSVRTGGKILLTVLYGSFSTEPTTPTAVWCAFAARRSMKKTLFFAITAAHQCCWFSSIETRGERSHETILLFFYAS